MIGAREPDLSTARIGRVELGSFRLVRLLGEGAFASAYVAEQLGTDRTAVVKIAHEHLVRGPTGAMIRERFAAEVRASTRVSHRNLVTIFSAGHDSDGLPALAMEHLEGTTLGQRLDRDGRLGGEETHQLFVELAEALRAIHRARVVHRDLSPENIFLARDLDGRTVTKVLDFGVAKLLDDDKGGNQLFGTPRYMAPEQMAGSADLPADMYAVGALLYFALTGHEVHEDLPDFPALMAHLRSLRVGPDPRLVEPRVPADVAILVQNLLDPHPDERPNATTFGAVWQALSNQVVDFLETSRRRTVAALLHPSRVNETLVRRLREEGHSVRLDPSLRLSSLVTESVEAVIIDAELRPGSTSVDALGLAARVSEVSPTSTLFVVTSRPLAAGWSNIGARLLALLPEQLEAVVGAISRGDLPPSSHWGNFAGVMAENLAHLGVALDELGGGDVGPLAQSCEAIERHAHVLGARDLGAIARTLRVLALTGELHDGRTFIDDIHSEYRAQFHRLSSLARGGSGDLHP
jgi:serine/threonine protein kinase